MEVRNYQTNEMNLNYFCQRYYDPEIGRFMSLDPFGGYIEMPQSQNRYAYCINNPLKYIDPLGLDWGNDPEAYTFKNPIMLSALIATAPRYLPILEQQYLVILEKMTPIATMDSRNAGGGYDRTWNRFKWTVLQDWLRSLKSVHETIFGKGRGGKRPSWWGSSGSNSGDEAERIVIIETYFKFMEENYPIHGSTYPPFFPDSWAWFLGQRGDEGVWACADWAQNLRDAYWGNSQFSNYEFELVTTWSGIHQVVVVRRKSDSTIIDTLDPWREAPKHHGYWRPIYPIYPLGEIPP